MSRQVMWAHANGRSLGTTGERPGSPSARDRIEAQALVGVSGGALLLLVAKRERAHQVAGD
jgi:hypothetical protein